MRKPIFIILSSVLVVAGIAVGVIFEVYKMSQDSILRLVKRDIVGDYDVLYDEYFPRYYHATGILSLPFDDIAEPFEAWFAGDRNMSRIDYYYGMDKTIQRGDLGKHGILFKIAPMHSEMKPSDNDFMSCWYKPLSKWLPRAGQSVIPTNLSEFKVRLLDDSWLPFKCSRTLVIIYR